MWLYAEEMGATSTYLVSWRCFPYVFSKQRTHCIAHVHGLQVQREHHLPPGDFPDVNRFRDILSAFDMASFPKLSKSMVKQIDDVLSVDIPNLVRAFDNPYS